MTQLEAIAMSSSFNHIRLYKRKGRNREVEKLCACMCVSL